MPHLARGFGIGGGGEVVVVFVSPLFCSFFFLGGGGVAEVRRTILYTRVRPGSIELARSAVDAH